MKIKKSGIELLSELSLAFGPSGCEGDVATIILQNIESSYDELIPDKMGGVIAKLCGSGKSAMRLMLSCHMDEVGFMVRHITDEGLVIMGSMMGSDTRIMAGRRVVIKHGDSFVRGVISIAPIHLVKKADREKAATMDELYIDIGAKTKADAEKYIKIGDFGVFESNFVLFGENDCMIKGKALDDRLGCAVMCDLLRELGVRSDRLPFDIYFAFTTREELGLSGARCAAHKIAPDKAIIFEATAIADIHGVPETARVAKRGEGGAVSIMDRSTIYDRELTDLILNTAESLEIPCQVKKYVSGGNDAGHIHKAAGGTKCAVISAPAAYIHTASSVIARDDYSSIYRLALATIEKMGKEVSNA